MYRAEGIRGLFTGWGPTLVGYSAQGAFKYGWYEYFKKTYSDAVGPENAHDGKKNLRRCVRKEEQGTVNPSHSQGSVRDSRGAAQNQVFG